MCRSLALAAFLVFSFAILMSGRRDGRNDPGAFLRPSVVSATDSFNKERDSHLVTAGNKVDITLNLQFPEPAISMDDLFAYFPMTVSKLVLHPANTKPPEMFRV
jgi:hypothetical protein